MTFWRYRWKQICFQCYILDNTLDNGTPDRDNYFDGNNDHDNNNHNSDDNNDDKEWWWQIKTLMMIMVIRQ